MAPIIKRASLTLTLTTVKPLLKLHSIKRSPSLKRSPIKVPEFASLDYCKLDLYLMVTSIKRTRSPFRFPNLPISLYFTSIKWSLSHDDSQAFPVDIVLSVTRTGMSAQGVNGTLRLVVVVHAPSNPTICSGGVTLPCYRQSCHKNTQMHKFEARVSAMYHRSRTLCNFRHRSCGIQLLEKMCITRSSPHSSSILQVLCAKF